MDMVVLAHIKEQSRLSRKRRLDPTFRLNP